MFAAAKQHLIQKLKSATVLQTPFPHVLIENIFPSDLYAAMMRNMPLDDQYQRLADSGRVKRGYNSARFCFFPEHTDGVEAVDPVRAFWRDFKSSICDSEFMAAWVGTFYKTIAERATAIRPAESADSADVSVYSEMFLMRDKESFELGPHWDAPSKALSALFYLPPDDRNSDLGTALYVPKDSDFSIPPGTHAPFEYFDLVSKAPFRPNTLLAFPNTPQSYHGVEPVAGAGRTRDVLLYDIKFEKQALS